MEGKQADFDGLSAAEVITLETGVWPLGVTAGIEWLRYPAVVCGQCPTCEFGDPAVLSPSTSLAVRARPLQFSQTSSLCYSAGCILSASELYMWHSSFVMACWLPFVKMPSPFCGPTRSLRLHKGVKQRQEYKPSLQVQVFRSLCNFPAPMLRSASNAPSGQDPATWLAKFRQTCPRSKQGQRADGTILCSGQVEGVPQLQPCGLQFRIQP